MGREKHTKKAAAGAWLPRRLCGLRQGCALSGRLLEVLGTQKEMRRREEAASFEAVCFSSWPLLGGLAGNRVMTPLLF